MNYFFAILFGSFICCFLWNYLLLGFFSKLDRPVVIELREKWRYKTRDSAIEDVYDCCSQIFCSQPESYLCKHNDKSRENTIDSIQNNECLDLYTPDDYHFFHSYSKLKSGDLCKVLQHFQTPLTRCLYSNKYVCDSLTGYLKRDTENTLITMIGLTQIGDYWYRNWGSKK